MQQNQICLVFIVVVGIVRERGEQSRENLSACDNEARPAKP